eukprot:TRINITY_DN11207_c0_g1_i1.p1 TRINITY_DN11207_c0_g1~~TRINITY_DN11207_c0_g1_i1.p1  ORF type:complete len:407 (+),score=88.73 TRINITY_DN11207_c0_g1_i1:59-1279(+)
MPSLSEIGAHAASERIELYKQWVKEKVAAKDITALGELVPHIADDEVPLSISRPVLAEWAGLALDIPESRGVENEDPQLTHDDMIQLGTAALESLSSRLSSFHEQSLLIRDCLSWVFQDCKEWGRAAEVLKRIPLDTVTVTEKGDSFKVQLFIRISRLYVEDENYYQAETWINKAWPMMRADMDQYIQLQFNACFARVHDGKRKFFDAARKYYELSHLVQGDEQGYALKQAIVCVMLSDAGPQRSRLLATLYKDERTQDLNELYRILQKMFLDRVLRPSDVEEVKGHLLPHHEAITADGYTVLERAVMQHNLRSASRLYYNINFKELGSLLDIPEDKAQRVAAKMISEGRLNGLIDQPGGMLVFTDDATVFNKWDQQISTACNSVSALADKIIALHPEYSELKTKN